MNRHDMVDNIFALVCEQLMHGWIETASQMVYANWWYPRPSYKRIIHGDTKSWFMDHPNWQLNHLVTADVLNPIEPVLQYQDVSSLLT